MDRFHPIPDVPARAASWAEWLYFNGRAATRTFLPDVSRRSSTGIRPPAGRRAPAARARGAHDVVLGFRGSRRGGAARVRSDRDDRTEPRPPDWPRVPHRDRSAGRSQEGPSSGRARPSRDAGPLAAAVGHSGRRGLGVGLRRAGDVGTLSGVDSDDAADASISAAAPAITITTGDSGRACRGSGVRCRAMACRSSTAACIRLPTPPTRAAFPASSWRSVPMGRSGTRRTSRSTRSTSQPRIDLRTFSCGRVPRHLNSAWNLPLYRPPSQRSISDSAGGWIFCNCARSSTSRVMSLAGRSTFTHRAALKRFADDSWRSPTSHAVHGSDEIWLLRGSWT